MTNICICILNYNQCGPTIRCVESVLGQQFDSFQVVIVDNCSGDDSIELIRSFLATSGIDFGITSPDENDPQLYPKKVVLVTSPKNGGYAAGNNLGIRYAQRSGRFTNILIINNDVIPDPGFLEGLSEAYRESITKNPDLKIALGSREFGLNGKLNHNGFHYLNLPTGLVFPFPLWPSFRYIVGSCIYLPAGAPLMNEEYFLYFDDADYSKILLQNNYNLSLAVNVSYRHDKGTSTRENKDLYKTIFSSLKIFYLQYYPRLYRTAIVIRFILNLLLFRFAIAVHLVKILLPARGTSKN